jgi:hypothetical protein
MSARKDVAGLLQRIVFALALTAATVGPVHAQLGGIEEVHLPDRPGFGSPSTLSPPPAPRTPKPAAPKAPALGAPQPIDPPAEAKLTRWAPVADLVVQQPGVPAGKDGEEPANPALQLKPPPPQMLFRLESEQALRSRIRKEALANPKLPRPEFPEDKVGTGHLTRRDWPWYTWTVEPAYLCHGRLFFEQREAERYGLDLGVVHPIISASIFFADVAIFPVRAALWPCHPYECHVELGTGFWTQGLWNKTLESGLSLERVGVNFP